MVVALASTVSRVVSSINALVGLKVTPGWGVIASVIIVPVTVVGIILSGQRAKRQTRMAQPRLVAAHIDWLPRNVLVMSVTNASPVPVRDVRGFAREIGDKKGRRGWLTFPGIPVAAPSEGAAKSQVVTKSGSELAWHLEFEFDDDLGRVWRKYRSKRRIARRVRRHKMSRPAHADLAV